MIVHLVIGWWLAPLIFTLIAFAWAIWVCRDSRTGSLGEGVIALVLYSFAAILSLIAWLLWALVR